MDQKHTVSLCMIVKDEEDRLAKCLASVDKLVDEIIIVDTGSSDGTLEIAKEYQAKIVEFNWQDDFSAARNHSLERATSEWVMYLDADEELDVKSKEDFYKLLSVADVEGYYFNIINPTSDSDGGGSLRHTNLRLFRNNPNYRFKGAIHEQIIPSILDNNPNAKLINSDIQILHHGYKKKIIKEKNKTARNLDILKKQLEQNPSNVFFRYNLAVALYENKDYDQALIEFETALKNVDYKSSYAPTLFRNYTICLMKKHKYELALKTVEDGIEAYPDYTDLYFLKAQTLEKLNKLTHAQDSYLKCLELGEAPLKYVSTAGTGSYLALYNLGQLMELCSHYDQAVNYYLKAYRAQPEFQDTLFTLGRALKKAIKEPLHIRAFIQDNIKATTVTQLMRLADLLYYVNDYYGCLLYINEAIILIDQKSDAMIMLKAKCLMQLGKWDEALLQYAEITPRSPFYLDAILESCICCWSVIPTKNPQQSINNIKNRHKELYNVLNTFNHKIFNNDVTTSQMVDNPSLKRLIAKLLQVKCRNLATTAASLLGDKSRGEIAYYLGKSLYDNNMSLDAADYLIDALNAGVSDDNLYFMLGNICLSRKLPWEAEQFIQQAIKLNAGRQEYYLKLVEILLLETSESLLEAIGIFPESKQLKDMFTLVRDCRQQIETARR